MGRIWFLGLFFALCCVLFSISIMPVFAKPGLIFVGSFGEAFLVDHADMAVEFLDFRRSPCGKADVVMVSLMVNGMEVLIMVVSDNAEFGALLDQLFAGMVPVEIVGEEELEVWRRGRTLYGELTVQVGDLHPVYAEFKGSSGRPMFGEEIGLTPSGHEMSMTYVAFDAVASFTYDDSPCQQTVGMMGSQFLMRLVPT